MRCAAHFSGINGEGKRGMSPYQGGAPPLVSGPRGDFRRVPQPPGQGRLRGIREKGCFEMAEFNANTPPGRLELNGAAPDFTASTTHGPLTLSQWAAGKW